jgi:ACT domain-containing protein
MHDTVTVTALPCAVSGAPPRLIEPNSDRRRFHANIVDIELYKHKYGTKKTVSTVFDIESKKAKTNISKVLKRQYIET